MSVIRVHKNKNFTVMSNMHLFDKNLSLKAAGLLSKILALPDNWNYSIKGLCAICKENETAVKNALNELRDRRYVIVERIEPSKETGGRIQYEYFVYEQPQGEENKKVDVKEAYKAKQEKEKQHEEIQGIENLGVDGLWVENRGDILNTNIQNTDKSNINKLKTNKQNTLSSERAASECEQPKPDNQKLKPTSRKKEANELFERLWSLYPLKKGKGSVSDTQKLKLLDIGYEEMERAISRYIRYVESVDYLHYKNGSTFFNSGYIDYLDENYTESNTGNNIRSQNNNQQSISQNPVNVKDNPEDYKAALHRAIEKAKEMLGNEFVEENCAGKSDVEIEGILGLMGIDVFRR